MPLFSVVIAVYNCEKYLEQCLDSILAQRETELEVVLVENGSQDSSLQICQRYAEQYNEVRLFVEEHRGPSATRNHGIREAVGDYILFVDSDDYVTEDSFNHLAHFIRKLQPDICYVNQHYVKSGDEITQYTVFQADEVYENRLITAKELLTLMNGEQSSLSGTTWLMICKRTFLVQQDLFFDCSLHWSEDADLSFAMMQKTDQIAVYPKPYYVYRQDNSQSISNIFSCDKMFGRMDVFLKWYHYYNSGEARNRYGYELCQKTASQLLFLYSQNVRIYSKLRDKDSRRKMRQRLLKEQNLWKQCNHPLLQEYVQHGLDMGDRHIRREDRKEKTRERLRNLKRRVIKGA